MFPVPQPSETKEIAKSLEDKYFKSSSKDTNEPMILTKEFASFVNWEKADYVSQLTPVALLQLSIMYKEEDFVPAMEALKPLDVPIGLHFGLGTYVIIKHGRDEFSRWELIHEQSLNSDKFNFLGAFIQLSQTRTHEAEVYSRYPPEECVNAFVNKLSQYFYCTHYAGCFELQHISDPIKLIGSLAWKPFKSLILKNSEEPIEARLINYAVDKMDIEEELVIQGTIKGRFDGFQNYKMKSIYFTNADFLTGALLATATNCEFFVALNSQLESRQFMRSVINWYKSKNTTIQTLLIETSAFDGDVPLDELDECRARPLENNNPSAVHNVPIGVDIPKFFFNVPGTPYFIIRADKAQAVVLFLKEIFIFSVNPKTYPKQPDA